MAILLVACNGQNTASESKNYEASKKTLLKEEQSNPIKFLIVTGKNKRNIVGQTVVRGTIKNNAALAKYKDISIKFYFYSKTKTLVETDEETIYDFLFPGETTQFKTKFFAPKGTDSVALEVLSAVVD